MKKILILILLLAPLKYTFSQGTIGEEKLENALSEARENPQKAIVLLKDLLEEEPDSTVVYAKAFFNVAVLYSSIGDIKNTTEWYVKVMASEFNPKDPTGNFFEPYACYQHNAAMQLGVFLYNNQLFSDAIKYFDKAKSDYPYLSTSGTSIGKRINAIDIWKSRCYFGKGELDKSIAILLTSSLSCYSPMKREIDQGIEQLVNEYYGKKKFVKEIKKGLKKLKRIGEERNEFKGDTIIWEISFDNSKVIICTEIQNAEKEKVLDKIKSNDWFEK